MTPGEAPTAERAHVPEASPLQKEYERCLRTLNKTEVISLLPQHEALGVIGVDGKEYPVPSAGEVKDLFDHNKELVDRKIAQGFTRLQLTPFGAPLATLVNRTRREILKHDTDGTIFQAKRKPTDPNTPVEVDREEPFWMWDSFVGGDVNGNLVYFPREFNRRHHDGLSKEQLIDRKTVCPIPGWSVALVEPSPFIPEQGKGKTIGGRPETETGSSPAEYLERLRRSYKEESGLTPEDFLVKFLTHLSETNQVSYDWNDNSAAWLTGVYLPNDGYVPYGRWSRGYYRLSLSRSDPDYRLVDFGAPSTVKLSI